MIYMIWSKIRYHIWYMCLIYHAIIGESFLSIKEVHLKLFWQSFTKHKSWKKYFILKLINILFAIWWRKKYCRQCPQKLQFFNNCLVPCSLLMIIALTCNLIFYWWSNVEQLQILQNEKLNYQIFQWDSVGLLRSENFC